MTEQPMERPECDHHWITYMQPSAGLSWIRQCSQCKDFDADDLQEQIAAAEQRGAEMVMDALKREASDPSWEGIVQPGRSLQELVDHIEHGIRVDRLEEA